MAGSDTVQSVERALDLLQALAASDGGLRLSDVAERLSLHTSTAHNLVRTLVGRGFVVKGAGQRLRLGPALADMVTQEQKRSLLDAAAKAGLELQRAFPLGNVNVAELVGNEVRVRVRISRDRLGLVQRTGQAVSLYSSAVGLCTLAFADPATVQGLRESNPFHEQATRLWESPAALAEHLAQARRVGHVLTPFHGQELWRIAVPVITNDGHYAAAFGVALPIAAATPAVQEALTVAVTAAAAGIGKEPT